MLASPAWSDVIWPRPTHVAAPRWLYSTQQTEYWVIISRCGSPAAELTVTKSFIVSLTAAVVLSAGCSHSGRPSSSPAPATTTASAPVGAPAVQQATPTAS